MFHVEILNQYTLEVAGQILGLKKSQVANIKAGTRSLTALEALLLRQSCGDRLLSFFNWESNEKIFWMNIETLQSHLNYNDAQMAQAFSCSLRIFRHSRSKAKSLPWNCCEYFGRRYKVHPALWFTNDVDIECLGDNIISPFRSNAYIPKRFEGGGSKMRLLANLVTYVHNKWGDEAAETLKSSLQITQESLNFEKDVSIRTFSEFHARLRAYGASDDDFDLMGQYNRQNAKNRRLLSQKVPADCKTYNQVFVHFLEKLIKTQEINRKFTVLKNTTTEICIKTEPTDVFLAAYLPQKPFAEHEIALYIKGHLKVIPTYFGLKEFESVLLDFDSKSGNALYTCKVPSSH